MTEMVNTRHKTPQWQAETYIGNPLYDTLVDKINSIKRLANITGSI